MGDLSPEEEEERRKQEIRDKIAPLKEQLKGVNETIRQLEKILKKLH